MSRNDSVDGSERSLLSDEDLSEFREFQWLPGIATGAAAWIGGYVLMAALFYVGPASIAAPSQTARLKQIGHLFYNAQFVDRVVSAPGNVIIPGGRRANFLLETSVSQVPVEVYFATPVVAILLAAVAFSVLSFDRDSEYVEAGLTGVAMAIGYTALAVVGTFLFVTTAANGDVSAMPDRLQTVAFAFAYPFFLGTLGSLVGVSYNRE